MVAATEGSTPGPATSDKKNVKVLGAVLGAAGGLMVVVNSLNSVNGVNGPSDPTLMLGGIILAAAGAITLAISATNKG